MTVNAGSRSHLEERDLFRYMDREMDRLALRRARGHLSQCDRCRSRLETMERQAAEVSAWLDDVRAEAPDPQVRARALAAVQRARYRAPLVPPAVRPFLRAAAIVLLVGGVTIASAPGRSWAGSAVERLSGPQPGPVATTLMEWLGHEPETRVAALESARAASPREGDAVAQAEEAAPAATTARRAGGASAAVPFLPRGSHVVVEFDNHQAAGVAVIRIGEVPQASAQVTSGLGGERIVPVADGIRIRNAPSSSAQYAVTVPGHYRFVRVRIAGGDEILLTASRAKQEWVWTVSLQEGADGG